MEKCLLLWIVAKFLHINYLENIISLEIQYICRTRTTHIKKLL